MPKTKVHKIDKIHSIQQYCKLLAGGRNSVNFLAEQVKGQGEGPGCSQAQIERKQCCLAALVCSPLWESQRHPRECFKLREAIMKWSN
jgi:hypothetical protein